MTSAALPSQGRGSVLAFLVWTFAFVAFGGTTLLATDPTARAIGVAVFAVPVVAWVVLRLRRRPDRLDLAVLLGMGAHLVVSLASLDRTASLEMSAVVVAYAAAFWAARAIQGVEPLRRALTTAVVIGLLFWLVVVAFTWVVEKVVALQHLGWPPPADPHQAWVWGSVNTPPVLALLAVPFIAWLAPGPTRRVIVTAWAVAALVVVPLSLGRSAWVGIAVALVAAELLLGQPILRRVSRWLGIGYRRLAVAATAATSLAVVVVAVTQLGTLAGQLDSRVRLWDQAVRLFAADPVSGAGPSTFGWARLTHVADYVDRVAAKDVHSVPLQTLADGGLVLAAGALVVLLAWVSLLVERWPAVDRYQRLAVAVMCGYAAFALLDDLAFLPTVTVLLVVLAAWAVPPAPSEPGRPWHPAVVPVVVIIAVAISLPSVPSMTLARLDAAVGREAAVAGDWATAIEAFRSAARLHPENAQLWMSIGLVAARAGRIDVATQAYEQARAINAGDPRPWGALAVLADDPEESLQLLEAASRRSNDPRYAYRLGDAYEAGGRDGAAARSYALAAAVWSDWWGAVPDGPREAAADHLQEAVAIVGPIGGIDAREAVWNAQLDLGHLASEAPAPWHAVAAAIQGEFAAARRALDGSPAAARTDQAAVAVARLACDRDAFTEATSRLAFRPAPTHPTDHPVAIGPPGVYREPELGDYQPISGSSVPDVAAWPLSFVEVPDCAW